MARIAGTDLPREKRLEIALTYIFGIGRSRSTVMLKDLEIDAGTKVRDLTEDEVSRIRRYIDQNYEVEGDLRREIAQNIRRKIEPDTRHPRFIQTVRGAGYRLVLDNAAI